jgi:hypothetical protein
MITIRCPGCRRPLKAAEEMIGETISCSDCGELVTVPRYPIQRPEPRQDGLTTGEFWMFSILFLLIPIVNVIVSSVLYYSWKNSQPRRANQINAMGFIIFGFHVFLRILIYVTLHV